MTKEKNVLDGKYLIGAFVLAVIIIGLIYANNNEPTIVTSTGGTVVETNEGSDAPVTILEYSDFKCPYCSRAVPIVNQIKEAYGDEVYVEFRQFPLSFHKGADLAAEASECARDQGEFWKYHDALFNAFFNERKEIGDTSVLKALAIGLGLDSARFNECLDGRQKKTLVQEHIQSASQYKVTGTPSFVINGRKIVGAQPFENFKKIIDEELAKAQG